MSPMKRFKIHWGIALICALTIAACGGDDLHRYGSGGGDPQGGEPLTRTTESFQGRYTQQTDILAVVDNSGSMAQELQAVKDNLQVFHDQINRKRLNDYRFAVTRTDAYTFEGDLVAYNGTDIVNGTSASAVDTMKGILGNVGSSAKSYWEQGLKASHLALTRHGPRFLRPSVDLAVFYLSDEQDYSAYGAKHDPLDKNTPGLFDSGTQPENFPEPKPWEWVPVQVYVDFLKGLGRSVFVYSIVGMAERICEAKSVGVRYQMLQTLMGTGFTAPICNDLLAERFRDVATAISNRGDCYRLAHTMRGNESDMEVRVDGVRMENSSTTGFHWDGPANSVCFSGSFLPSAGASLSVSYLY